MTIDKEVRTINVKASTLHIGDIILRGSNNQFRVVITHMNGNGLMEGIIGRSLVNCIVWTVDDDEVVAKEVHEKDRGDLVEHGERWDGNQ